MVKIPTTQFGVTLPTILVAELNSLIDAINVQSKSQYVAQALQLQLAQDRPRVAPKTHPERSYKGEPLKQVGLRIPTTLVAKMDKAIDGIAYINRTNFVIAAIHNMKAKER